MIDYFAALVTAQNADGFTITGCGTIDGNGLRFWEEFWIRRKWNKKCTNLEALRPQLVYISDSRDVTVQDVRLVNSPFWTNHLYRCERVRYIDCHIESPTFGDYHAPSSDALDLDVCDDVVVRGCYMNICDDAVCLKGGKGTFVDQDSTAGPVNRVLVERCRFGRLSNGGITFGSEAWNCHNVVMRDCQFENAHHIVLFKMRPDTPQHYEYVLVESFTGKCTRFLFIHPWTQFYEMGDRPDMPLSACNNIVIRDIRMNCNHFFDVALSDKYTLRDFTFERINVSDEKDAFDANLIPNTIVKDVVINGVKR